MVPEKRYRPQNTTKRGRAYRFKWYFEVDREKANRKRRMAMATSGDDSWDGSFTADPPETATSIDPDA